MPMTLRLGQSDRRMTIDIIGGEDFLICGAGAYDHFIVR